MTELAYLAGSSAAYIRTFRARITALPPGAVVLDRTYFYPTGGGQPSDLGFLSGLDGRRFSVREVVKSGPSVVHRLARPYPSGSPPELGAELLGEVDWPRRYRHMRLHSAQHLLSARIFAITGCRTRRASFAGSGGTIDLDATFPPEPSAEHLAQDVNQWVTRDLGVRVRTVPRAEWESQPMGRSGLVPLSAHVDPVRVIEIDEVDLCPCGGTHVRSTSELGPIAILPPTPLSGGSTRVAFTLGEVVPPTPDA